MKNKKLLLMPFLLTVLFFVGMNGVEAQANLVAFGNDVIDAQQDQFQSPYVQSVVTAQVLGTSEALGVLLDEAKAHLVNPDLTTPLSEATSSLKAGYYEWLYTNIDGGMSVSDALINGPLIVDRDRELYSKLLPINKQAIIDEAYDLLTQ